VYRIILEMGFAIGWRKGEQLELRVGSVSLVDNSNELRARGPSLGLP
jgi:hypothetical protein